MPIPLNPVSLSPGVAQQVSLVNLGAIQAVKLTNGTPFDLTVSGFGSIGGQIVPAGLEYMLHADQGNEGYLNILPVNNNAVTGTGVANLVVYTVSETLPKGQWPATVPTQVVNAKVSTVQTLSNEGNAVGTLVIDMGPTVPGQVVSIWNDHFTWSVVQAGVAHQVLNGQTAGNPLQIGQNGDTTEVLGSVLVDQSITIDANINLINTGAVSRLFAAINTATNDATIWTNSDHGLLHIRNSANNADIATFADASQVSTFLGSIAANDPATTVNGSVSGSCVFFTPVWGSALKILIVELNAWNSASVAVFNFPSAFVWGGSFNAMANNASLTWSLYAGGVAQGLKHLLTLGSAGAAGTDENVTAMHFDNIGTFYGVQPGQIQVGGIGGTAITGIITIIGV